MTLEHAPQHRRGYFTSFTLSGTQAGQLIATLVFIPVAALPEEQLLSWGWRVPFWLSVAVAVVGYVIRRNLEETPAFEQQAADRGRRRRCRSRCCCADHWADVLRVVAGCADRLGQHDLHRLGAVVRHQRLGRHGPVPRMLWVGALANVVALGAIPLWATLSDRIGRRPVFLDRRGRQRGDDVPLPVGDLHGLLPAGAVLGILAFGVVYSAANGIWPVLLRRDVPHPGPAVGHGDRHPDRLRHRRLRRDLRRADRRARTATTGPRSPLFTAALCVPPVVAALTARETAQVPTEQLGERADRKTAQPETVTA